MNEQKLQELIDHHDIRQVLYRYCRGIDRLDEELIASVYHEGSQDNHGNFQGEGATFAKYVIEALKASAATTHTLGQSLISVKGNKASSETYIHAVHTREEGEETYLDHFSGRYVDKLERREGQWGIIDRVVVWDWSKTERIEAAFYSRDDFPNGQRSRDDLCYQEV